MGGAACLIWNRQGVAPWLRVLVEASVAPAALFRMALQSVPMEKLKGGFLLPEVPVAKRADLPDKPYLAASVVLYTCTEEHVQSLLANSCMLQILQRSIRTQGEAS